MRKLSVFVVAVAALTTGCTGQGADVPGQAGAPSSGRSWVEVLAGPRTLLRIQQGGKWGYVDRSGKVAIVPQFDQAEEFVQGRAIVCVGTCKHVEEEKGEYGIAGINRFDGKFGVIDETGKFVVNPQFDSIQAGLVADTFGVCQGLACRGWGTKVDLTDKKWGYLNRDGKMLIPPQFQAIEIFSEGLAAVCKEKCGEKEARWGFIDASGTMVIEPQFTKAEVFWSGVAAVTIGTGDSARRGYIDKTGQYVVNPQ